jgi:hypothetical protein
MNELHARPEESTVLVVAAGQQLIISKQAGDFIRYDRGARQIWRMVPVQRVTIQT